MKHSVIKKVLLCRPTYFSTLNYSINPWMLPGKINERRAMRQWISLVNVYKSLFVDVAIIEQQKGSPDMVFAADQAIAQGKKVILSNFWYKERRGETKYFDEWFTKKGYEVKHLPTDTFFEGNGDTLLWKDLLFIGVGYRANKKTCLEVSKIIEKKVIPLEIINPFFYHLDLAFLPLNNEAAFYFPPAFSPESRQILKKEIPNLIEFTREEAFGYCANSVATGHQVIHQKGNPSFQNKLKELGYASIEINVDEFKKSGGGIHCLTNVLEVK